MTLKKTTLFIILLLAFMVGCIPGGGGLEATATMTPVPTNTATPTHTPTLEQIPPAFTQTATPAPEAAVTATPTSAPCQRPFGWVDYIVQPGNTLSVLARRTGASVQEIMVVNCLNNDIIYVAQTLFLPRQPGGDQTVAPPTVVRVTARATTGNASPAFTPIPTNTSEVIPPTSPTPTTPPPTPMPTDTVESLPPVGPGDPQLTITPFSGPIGTTYTLYIEGYDPNETVTIQIYNPDDQIVLTSSTVVDNIGEGIFQFYSEPGDAPGLYLILVTGEGGSPQLFTEFEIDG